MNVMHLPRAAVYRLQRTWEKARPLSHPRYLANVPRVGDFAPPNVFRTANPLTLGAAAMSREAQEFVLAHIDRLTPSDEILGQKAFFELSRAQFGEHWRYADITTTLWAAAKLLQPKSYFEIGVHRGRSSALVAAVSPDCDIYGFDLWVANYAGVSNPGAEFVRRELETIGHRGKLSLVTGDSRLTVPEFLSRHNDLFYDLITVDGAHTVDGAASDLANALPRLKLGGIIVLDDISRVPGLSEVWRRLVKSDRRYGTWEFTDAGYGVAAAIRIGR